MSFAGVSVVGADDDGSAAAITTCSWSADTRAQRRPPEASASSLAGLEWEPTGGVSSTTLMAMYERKDVRYTSFYRVSPVRVEYGFQLRW
jgi:hypothetical protein